MPTYTMKGPDGRVYQLQAGDDVSREKAEAELRRRIGAQLGEQPSATPTPTPAPVTPAPAVAPKASAEIAKRMEALDESAASLNRMIAETQRLTKLRGATAGMRENANTAIEEYRKTLANIKNEKAYMQRTGTLVPERSFGDIAVDTLKGLGAGALRSVAGIPSILGAVGIESPGKASEEAAEGFIARNLAPDDSDAAKFGTLAQQGRRLSEAAGSVAPAFVTRGASRLGMAAAGSRAVPTIARVEQAAQLALGAGPGAQQQRQAIEQYEAQTGQTVNPAVRALAQTLGAAIGATEVLTLDAMMARVPSKLRGSMTAKIAGLAERVQVGGMSPKAAAAEARALVADVQKTARGRIGVASLEEGTQEAGAQLAQNVVEKGLYNAEKDITEGVGENFTYGAIVGGGLRGGVEVAQKVLGPKGDVTSEGIPIAPEIKQEFHKLAAQEVAAIMTANPDIDQKTAVDIVAERGEELLTQAAANVVGAEGEADVVPDADTGMDVTGGVGAGAAADIGTTPPVSGDTDLGETVGGGLEQPVSGVSVPDVGEGAGVSPLTVPPAPVFDITPIMEAPTLKERTSAAKQIASEIVATTPELQGLPPATYGSAVNQMARSAARGEQFDPVDVVYNVAGIERPAPATVEETATVEAPPAVRTVNDMAGLGSVNPDNTNEVLVGGGGLQLTPLADNILKVDSLRAVETGGGRKAMEQLTEVADANGTELQLSPEPFAAEAGKEMTPTELSEWYRGFGFQEQPDGTMVRPAPTAAPSTITPATAATPQEILADLESFAISEAQDRDFDQDAFLEGVDDIRSGREPLAYPDALKAYGSSGKFEINDANDVKASSRVAGAQWAQDRVAEAQAAATPAPAEVAPAEVASQAAPEGGAEPLTDASVDAALSVKLTKAQIKRLEEAAGIRRMKLNNMQKRIAQSRNSTETMNLAGKLMLIAKNPDADVNMLTNLFNSVPPPVLSAVLSFLDTNDVVRLGERAGMANPTRINNMVRDEYIPYVNRLMQRASRLSEEWADFTADSPEGADAMADVMFFSNMIDADPALAPNAAAYMKIDQKLQDLLAAQAKATDPKKKSNLKGQVTERRGEITRLYSGGEGTDLSGNPITVKGWNDVPPKGKQIFRKARDHYREDFKEHYRLLIERIDDAGFDEETADRLKAAVNDMFADAMKRTIYFPMKRFGEYWVAIGKGKSGEFHMFESFLSQQAFIARRRLNGDIRSVSSGYGRDSLRKLSGEVSDVSEALKGILNMIDAGGATDPNMLKDGVFQMYLSALPEADIRRRFIHRQFKTGFSTDVLRTFATTSVASANQLGRLAYNGKINNLIDQSYDETEENPSKPRLDVITSELERRLGVTLSGDAESFADRVANGFAKGTFLWVLSSPKSAFMNLTQLHLTGFPTLTAEFGEVATAAMAARYTGQLLTGQRIAYAVRDEEGNVRLSAPKFTAQSSAYIRGLRETDPDRYAAIQKAWLYGEEREVTQSTFTSAQSIYERSNKPSGELGFMQSLRAGNKGDATKQAVSNTIDGMGAMFHHSERIGREIMYASAFELAYDRNLEQGMDPEVAGDEAMALAVKLTNEGMFDFSNWNKPRAFKHPVGRVALQMRSYSFQMTSLLVRSTFNLIAAQRTKAERLAAARVFLGVGAMTTLYAGLRSSQFYILGMLGYGIYKFFESMGEDDEEEQEIEQGVVSSETIERQFMKFADNEGRELGKKDMDMFIRTSWIPETFTGGLQEVFGFSDDTADKLSLVADIGLPALAGVDLSNSVALTNLWHPVDTKSDNTEAQRFEALGRIILGPSGSFITAWNKFDDEANKGNFDKAIEALLPAVVRNYVKSERLQEEGLVIGKNQDIVLRDPSFYTAYISGIQALGFPEAETSRDMQLDIRAGEIEREVAQERTDLLDKRYRAILDMVADPSEDSERELAKVERDIQIYSLNYPSNAIDEDAKLRSFEQKQQEAAERMYGVGYNPKIPVRQPLAEERMERMLEEK